jgi:hypothetical protein
MGFAEQLEQKVQTAENGGSGTTWGEVIRHQLDAALQRMREAQVSPANSEPKDLQMTPIFKEANAGQTSLAEQNPIGRDNPKEQDIGKVIGPAVKGVQPAPKDSPYSGNAPNTTAEPPMGAVTGKVDGVQPEPKDSPNSGNAPNKTEELPVGTKIGRKVLGEQPEPKHSKYTDHLPNFAPHELPSHN